MVPEGVRFDAVPTTRRCSLGDLGPVDHSYGRDAGSVRARRPLGNIGVQYGLQALQYRTISVAQFLSLNEDIGGLDVDFRRTIHRTAPDGEATVAAYRTGRLLSGGGGLGDIPIIDYRADTDALGAPLDMRYHTFVVQSRLITANKDADNQVRLTDSGRGRFQLERGVVADAIKQMDVWITTMKGLKFGGHAAAVESKPDDLVDACWTPDGRKIAEEQTYYGPTSATGCTPRTPPTDGRRWPAEQRHHRLPAQEAGDRRLSAHHGGAVQEAAGDLPDRCVRLETRPGCLSSHSPGCGSSTDPVGHLVHSSQAG